MQLKQILTYTLTTSPSEHWYGSENLATWSITWQTTALSTGMKQKASLAISLVHDPEVIIFDEPTNGLDVLTAKVVTDFLLELKAQGRTVILSTHIFSLIEKLCDRVAVVIDGQLAACDTLAGLQDGMSLEDRFFRLYAERKGEQV